jgi:hypothetical protein
VTELDWLSAISADRPVLLIAEGVTMYLTEDSGLALLRRVVERFPSGELQFDVFNRFGIRTQKINSVVRRAAAMSVFDDPVFSRLPRSYRVMARLMSLVPSDLRDVAEELRRDGRVARPQAALAEAQDAGVVA